MYRFTFRQVIKHVSDTTGISLIKASAKMGRSSNYVSSKLQFPSVRLNTAIAIANAFDCELVLYPRKQPIPDYALALKPTPEDGEAID